MDVAVVDIAVVVVVISIMLSGIVIGLGRALGYRHVERFGIEELFQSILNAALIGATVVIIEIIQKVSVSLVNPVCAAGADAMAELACMLDLVSTSTFSLLNETLNMMTTIGYFQTLVLNFGSYSIQPFINLQGVSGILSSQVLTLNLLLILVNLNSQIVAFFSASALTIFFPVGLLLRSFFATRRIGGFLIGLALGLYILYPAFVLAFPIPSIDAELTKLTEFNANPFYATVPIVNVGNKAIAEKMDNMSSKSTATVFTTFLNGTVNVTTNQTYVADLNGDLTMITQSNANAISKVLLYAVIAPLISLIVTFVFVKEISSVLGGEFQFKAEVI